MKLFIMRHGSADVGLADQKGLSDAGRHATLRVRAQMGELVGAIPKILSSPLNRAIETAQLMVGQLDIPIFETGGLLHTENAQAGMKAIEPYLCDHLLVVGHESQI